MEIPSLEDFKALEQKIDLLLSKMEELKQDSSRILTSEEIMFELKISYQAFLKRVPALSKHGMFKEGRLWRMKRIDLERYQDHLSGTL